jgi:hypothetical protein
MKASDKGRFQALMEAEREALEAQMNAEYGQQQ